MKNTCSLYQEFVPYTSQKTAIKLLKLKLLFFFNCLSVEQKDDTSIVTGNCFRSQRRNEPPHSIKVCRETNNISN